MFEWFAVEAYKKSEGSIWSLVVILCIVTAVLSAFLDNVTTVLLLTIMAVAFKRGARGLESIELVAVTIKLAIIIGVLMVNLLGNN